MNELSQPSKQAIGNYFYWKPIGKGLFANCLAWFSLLSFCSAFFMPLFAVEDHFEGWTESNAVDSRWQAMDTGPSSAVASAQARAWCEKVWPSA
ncbi:MAG: hypothetical protein ACO1QB_16640 [Verrucomicrobiales bacterium]